MRTPSRSLLVAAAASLTVAAGAGTAVAASSARPTTVKAVAPAAKTQVLKISANSGGQLMFSTMTLKAKPGKAKIEFTNNSPLVHNFTLSLKGKVIGSTPQFKGGTKSITVTLKKGNYTYYCDVPGHRQAGMQGTLKVS